MAKIKIQIKGVAAELVLGNYMPTDPTIMKNWEDFYHYNDLIHQSQLLADYIELISIEVDDKLLYTGKIPAIQFKEQKSYSPVLVHRALYLRTECAEKALYECEFETANFDKTKLVFETQNYDLLFKVGEHFVSKLIYEGRELELNWVSGQAIGNLCILCRYENGFLVPIYDAIKKIESK